VLAWLRDDKIVSAETIERTARRFAGGNSAQHPLVRIGSAGLTASATARCSTPRR
jgi:general secretion pathway protein E